MKLEIDSRIVRRKPFFSGGLSRAGAWVLNKYGGKCIEVLSTEVKKKCQTKSSPKTGNFGHKKPSPTKVVPSTLKWSPGSTKAVTWCKSARESARESAKVAGGLRKA